MKNVRLLALLAVIAAVVSVGAFARVGLAASGGLAPLNPKFIEYQKELYDDASRKPASRHAAGVVPSPLDLSYLRRSATRAADGVLPAKYDLRDEGFVTPIRSQSPYGTCWAHATLAAMESSALKKLKRTYSLSPIHLAWFGYKDEVAFDNNPNWTEDKDVLNAGGTNLKAAATLARWTGAVLEKDVPYVGGAPKNPASAYADALNLHHAFVLVPAVEPDPKLAADDMKRLVMSQGGLSVSYSVPDEDSDGDHDDIDDNDGSTKIVSGEIAVYNREEAEANHQVMVAGWDDNYSKSSFGMMPPGDGAWLIKNSWGEIAGEDGYYWISYYDKSFGEGMCLVPVEAGKYESNYQYDPLGWVNNYRIDDASSHWMANIFTATRQEEIAAVSFYTTDADQSYSIFVKVKGSGSDGSDLLEVGSAPAAAKGVEAYAGYHTIELGSPVAVNPGDRFSVIVKLESAGDEVSVPVEYPIEGYSSGATARPGESFVSLDGEDWKDLTLDVPDGNVCIKAFGRQRSGEGVSTTSSGCSALNGAALAVMALTSLAVILRRR